MTLHSPIRCAAAAVLLALLAAPGAIGWAGEPTGPAANVVYPVDYTAQKARLFEEVELPLINPPPAGARLARRYCAGGQARLLAPRIEGHRLRAVVYVPPYSRLCAEVVALSATPAATGPAPEGLVPVDPEQDRAELARIAESDQASGGAGAEVGLPAWLSYLLVLVGLAGLVIAAVYGIVHLVRRLRELSAQVRQLQQEQAQLRTIGFVLRDLRVETVPAEPGKSAEIRIVAGDGQEEQAVTTTLRRADILRELLQRHPEPVPRFTPNQTELINPTELTRLRKELAQPLGTLLALQLVQNNAGRVLLNPHLYCPPAATRRPEG
jgi:hypothetical protein